MTIVDSLVIAALLAGAAGLFPPAEAKGSAAITIRVCRVELTDLGRSAAFHFNFIYRLRTNPAGAIEEVTMLKEPSQSKLVGVDKLKSCMKSWNLSPSSTYTVVFSVGTTSAQNYISIS